jgi:hypothetical protein
VIGIVRPGAVGGFGADSGRRAGGRPLRGVVHHRARHPRPRPRAVTGQRPEPRRRARVAAADPRPDRERDARFHDDLHHDDHQCDDNVVDFFDHDDHHHHDHGGNDDVTGHPAYDDHHDGPADDRDHHAEALRSAVVLISPLDVDAVEPAESGT